jgi:hypothetical protein
MKASALGLKLPGGNISGVNNLPFINIKSNYSFMQANALGLKLPGSNISGENTSGRNTPTTSVVNNQVFKEFHLFLFSYAFLAGTHF